MNIRNRLTFLFIGMMTVILGIASVAIYYFSADHRYEDFYNRLASKANNTAKLLIEVDEIDAELLAKIEKDNPVSLPKEKILIYDYKNVLLYSSDAAHDLPVTTELLDQIRLEHEVRFEHTDLEVLGLLYAGKYDRFVVLAAATDTYGKKKLGVLVNILVITFVISTAVISFAGWIYSGRALRPISKVVDQVEKISERSLDIRLDEGNRYDELGRLAITFNNMLNRLEKAFEAQRNFIANASHELRTPLTSITGKIEVALMQTRRPEEYEDVLMSLLREVRNLNQLSNRLLLLAQTSAEGATTPVKPVRIDELVWQAQDDVRNISSDYTVSVDFELGLDDELLTVVGDGQLLKVAVANLMENGCKYSSDHRVQVTVGVRASEIILTFTDHGIGIPLEEHMRIFQPFYRAGNAKLQSSGHGIGLSLVSRIITIHQGRLNLRSAENQGSVFEVALPLSPGNLQAGTKAVYQQY